ncbi:hypothetical protein AcV7_001061 [Taiwanofungus camphoratus]|nr:hypothetical protein AcW2_000448 [Antrodia cinnamomea]KAI0962160.1 hypothetical protein AcV7_001061 [Antrodia cinnamomea]
MLSQSLGLSPFTSCPINVIPDELVAMIISLWSEIDEDAVWMASGVCQHWRRVVLANPTIWSRIYLHFKPAPPKLEPQDEAWCIEEDEVELIASSRGKLRPLPLWIERAGTAELAIHMQVHTTSPMLSVVLGEAITLLAPEMARVRELEVSVDSNILATELLSLLWEVAQPRCLRHFAMLCTERAEFCAKAEELHVLTDILHNAPRMKSLTCKGCFPLKTMEHDFPSSRLRSLDLADLQIDLRSLLPILLDCDNLTILHMLNVRHALTVSWWSRKELNSPPVTVTLPALKQLYLHKVPFEDFVELAPCLDAPNLCLFSLQNLGYMEEYQRILRGGKSYDTMSAFGNAVAAFTARTPALAILHLSSSLLPDRYLLKALQHLPHLAELRLNNLLVGAPAFRGLTPPYTKSPSSTRKTLCPEVKKSLICPRLTHLTISNCDLLAGNLLVDFVRARKKCLDTLQVSFLDVRECKKVDQDHASSIRQMLDTDAELTYEPKEI